MWKWLLLGMAVLSVGSCGNPPRRPLQTGIAPPGMPQPPAGLTVYRIDPERSEVRVLVYRAMGALQVQDLLQVKFSLVAAANQSAPDDSRMDVPSGAVMTAAALVRRDPTRSPGVMPSCASAPKRAVRSPPSKTSAGPGRSPAA